MYVYTYIFINAIYIHALSHASVMIRSNTICVSGSGRRKVGRAELVLV